MYSPMRPPARSTPFPSFSPQGFSSSINCSGSSFNDSLDHSLTEGSVLGHRRSYSESSLCDRSILDHDGNLPQTPDQSKCAMPLRRATSLSHLLVVPTPPSKVVPKQPKSSGRVLTSLESIKQLEEKERQKELALQEKEQRKVLREEKRKLVLQKKEQQQKLREEKRKVTLQKKEQQQKLREEKRKVAL